jgi:quercetin dioxygenase-like cupin family protein
VDKAKSRRAFGFPRVINDLPEADVPFPGVRAWILQGENHQLIFFEMQPTAVVPEHSHRYPQWGMVVQGTMRLTINGKTSTIQKGDDYLIPAEAKHHARFLTRTQVIDLFSERTRYKAKPTKCARAYEKVNNAKKEPNVRQK